MRTRGKEKRWDETQADDAAMVSWAVRLPSSDVDRWPMRSYRALTDAAGCLGVEDKDLNLLVRVYPPGAWVGLSIQLFSNGGWETIRPGV
jgi:hypothetical protein